MSQIVIYNNGQRVAKTGLAFNIIETKELMRSWVLTFSIVNIDKARQYIQRGAIYEIDGQKFDNKQFNRNSGQANTTTVGMAFHVSRRLDRYTIPVGYAFVGSIRQIIQDILNTSGAYVEFSIGDCEDIYGSYSIGNTQPITARAAIVGLTALGVEPSFDNFTINANTRWGDDTGKTFKFGRDLCDLSVNDNELENTTTYTIDIATLMRLSDSSNSDYFEVGDTVKIQDDIIGETIQNQRICCYEKHHDNPAQDKVTIGQFIPDITDTISTMQVQVDNSVQQSQKYSNVSIDRQNGFMAISEDGTIAVKMNANNCFAVYKIENGKWTLMSELDVDGLQAATLTMPGYPNFKVVVGKGPNPNDSLGLFIIDTNISPDPFFKIWYSSDGNVILQKTLSGEMIFADENGYGIGSNDTLNLFGANVYLNNGLVSGYDAPGSVTVDIPVPNFGTVHVKNGIIVNIT